jgi:hypothetical protein
VPTFRHSTIEPIGKLRHKLDQAPRKEPAVDQTFPDA